VALPAVRNHLHHAPVVVFVCGILLAWRFHRSRVVLALLALAVADRLLLAFPSGPTGRFVADAVAIALPALLGAMALFPDRGLRTISGQLMAGLVVLPILVFTFLYRIHPAATMRWLERPLLPWSSLRSLPAAQPALLAYALTSAVLLLRIARRSTPLDAGFFWALAGSFVACVGGGKPVHATFYFAAAALALVLAAVEVSYAMAFRDDLTGLPGRRALNERLAQLGKRYTAAMIDIDHFKKVNDRHGHDVGDEVLRKVATKLARITGGGKAYRYGGEEFAVLFPGKGVKDVLPHLEQLREAVAEAKFAVRGSTRPKRKPKASSQDQARRRTIPVTVSIGAAERAPRTPRAEQVIEAADRALYRAKKGGRNQVRS
jgi:diguanylate cyclase (GGDEF)-like protein